MITAGADITSVYHAAATGSFYNERVRPQHSPGAVLFDLDDTLFDHEHAARAALSGVHQSHADFTRLPFDAFERAHARILEEMHVEVLTGRRGLDDAREERFRRLFAESGVRGAADDAVRATAARYREAYLAARRPVDGALALLSALKPRVRIGIVSNNLLEEQQAKITLCGFDAYIDALVVSETAGATKPDPAIFARALEELGCAAADAVMIGDSWAADVEGARAAGIRPIWFNRAGRPSPDALAGIEPGVCAISTLAPMDAVMTAIFGDDSPSDRGADLRCASA
jgi:HAD superfamily hydrolase (TIGR01549 family)